MSIDRWNAFLDALPPEYTEDLPRLIEDKEYCVCGCGVDRMVEDCLTGHRY